MSRIDDTIRRVGIGRSIERRNKPSYYFGLIYAGANLAYALPNSRLQENEADKLGLIFAAMAGYDPAEAIPL